MVDGFGSESQSLLIQLEDAAKAAGKGKWGSPEEVAVHVRDVKWQVDNTRHFVESNKNKEIDGMQYAVLCITRFFHFFDLPGLYNIVHLVL